MTSPDEARAAARARLAADPALAARRQAFAHQYRIKHPTYPAQTAQQQWQDFHATEAANEERQERKR